MTKSVNTREIILDILMQVMEQGDFCHITINQALKKYQYLEKQERSFIKRTAEGTIEEQIYLDYVINKFSSIAVKKMKPVIRNILRMAVYQIIFMDSVPNSAACDEAVKLTKKRGFFTLKGFVNGLLRNIDRHLIEIELPAKKEDVTYYYSIKYSMPEWLVKKWIKSYGEEQTDNMLSEFLKESKVSVRCNTSLKSEEAIRRMLEEENVICEPADIGVPAYYISEYDYIESLSAFREGYIQVQDISSMLVGKIADPAQDNYVIDVCAAPGGKSLHIADLLKDTGCVEARDLTMQKVMLIKENIERCHANNVVAVVKDALELDETAIDKADIVICDLPCSGLGIIGRKADIKYKVDEEKIEQLANLQREILKVVQNYVKPGGCLIFSTCTVNQTENDENVRWFEENYGFELESIEEYLPEKFRNRTGDRGYIQIFPKAGENDGFFISKFRRKKV